MEKKKRNRRKFTTEFKISVIMDVFRNNLNWHEASRKYGIERHTLRIWGRKLLEEGALWDMNDKSSNGKKIACGKVRRGRPRKKADTAGQEMADRFAYLEMENAYLKKLWALVRAERLQGSKEQK